MAWSVFAAAVTGTSHVDSGLACQDAFAYQTVGNVLVAVVCDGAGSAEHSEVGAQFFAREVVKALAARLQAWELLLPLSTAAITAAIGSVVESSRDTLAGQIQGMDLQSHAATLVGVLIGERGGHFFHIGDGVAVAQLGAGAGPVVSVPENGEYANETYFVTGEAWREHLRITAIGQQSRWVALMSDGASSFVMSRGNECLYPPFIEPVQRYLAGVSEPVGSSALEKTLADPRTHAITGDDKALLMALWSD